MGVGIVTMHYIGMSALHASAHMIHAPPYVAASVAVAIAASRAGALARRRPRRAAAADPVGDRVRHCDLRHALHRDGGADACFRTRAARSSAPALSTDLLAIVVAVVAFCVSGIFLLILVPDRARRGRRAGRADAAAAPAQLAPLPVRPLLPATAATAEFGRGSYAPLGGAGGPPRALRAPSAGRARRRARISSRSTTSSRSTPTPTTPISSTGRRSCSARSPIGDVEARLDTDRFVRVHRSHIVNIERVVRLKRRRRQRPGRARGGRPLRGAGQPQPGRLAEVARRRSNGRRRRRHHSQRSQYIADRNSDPADCVNA